MPIYEYECKNCKNKFDTLVQRYSEACKVIECPECKEMTAEKQMSAFTTQGLDHNVGVNNNGRNS